MASRYTLKNNTFFTCMLAFILLKHYYLLLHSLANYPQILNLISTNLKLVYFILLDFCS